jgi:hypothetical protein
LVAINHMFKDKKLTAPINLRQDTITGKIIKDAERYESLPNRRLPLSKHMVVEMVRRGQQADRFSFFRVMANFLRVGKNIGPRMAEYAQEAQRIGYYIMPDGQKVVKALTRDDIVFKDDKNKVLRDPHTYRHKIHGMDVCFKVQKNRQNMQVIPFIRDKAHHEYCAVLAMEEIVETSFLLGQPSHLPLGVFRDGRGKVIYLTGRAIADYFREIARELDPDMSEEDILRFSAHSIRVLACVLLHEAGKDGPYIKLRLRWLSDAYLVYLRNTQVIGQQHADVMSHVNDQMRALALTSVELPHIEERDDTNNISLDFTDEEY